MCLLSWKQWQSHRLHTASHSRFWGCMTPLLRHWSWSKRHQGLDGLQWRPGHLLQSLPAPQRRPLLAVCHFLLCFFHYKRDILLICSLIFRQEHRDCSWAQEHFQRSPEEKRTEGSTQLLSRASLGIDLHLNPSCVTLGNWTSLHFGSSHCNTCFRAE